MMMVMVTTVLGRDLRGRNFEELNLPNKELANKLIHGRNLQDDILRHKKVGQQRQLTPFLDRKIDSRANTVGAFKFFAVRLFELAFGVIFLSHLLVQLLITHACPNALLKKLPSAS